MIKKAEYYRPHGKSKQLVVFLHGYGSNKDDLISLAPFFREIMPDALFVSPNAPYRHDFIFEGYQWFSLDNGIEFNDKNIKEIKESINDLNEFIDKTLKENDISEENLYLIGFSQGATMSIYTSEKRKKPIKGILAYSGIIFKDLSFEKNPNIVGIIHGKLDDVVDFSFHIENIKKLEKANINTKELIIEKAYHEIPLEAVEFGKKILKETL